MGDYTVHDHGLPIKIDNYCWLGLGCCKLMGVVHGDHAIVAAGTFVTKSFLEGYCIVGGVPTKITKHIDKDRVREKRYEIENRGCKKSK